ncbi:MAG: surface protein [Flavipsychrobacter sp.]|nr:surface protein [Flavipsychrobacter sp.]
MKKMYKILTLLSVVILAANSAFAQPAWTGTVTFNYSGNVQTYVIPAGVDSVRINVQGAVGGKNGDVSTHFNVPGSGVCAAATYSVAPGFSTYVYVGGKGGDGGLTSSSFTPGGFNGGGRGGFLTSSVGAGGGGGGSDVRFGGTSLANRVIVGAGGGGSGSGVCGARYEDGGNGGGLTGTTGSTTVGFGTCSALGAASGGGGGTQIAGGAAGFCTTCGGGAAGAGGSGVGGDGASSSPGGGGGGGYYGGGGGKYTGGGGGSSFYATFAIAPAPFTPGCGTSDGTVSIVNHCIPQTITATRTTICPYETLTLSDNVGGGSWSSGNSSIASINSSTGVVSGTFPGLSTLQTVVMTYTAGPCSATQTITVNPLPPAITGSTTICSGLTSNLTDAVPGGTWTGTGVTSVDPFGVLSGTTAGTGTVTYANPTTGCYITAPTLVNPLPANITGNFQVCVGLTQTLSDATPLGTWTSGSTTIADIDINTGVVTGKFAGSGSDLITYTITSTGCIKTHSFTVNPLPDPVTGTLTLCEAGGTTTLTNFTPFGPGTWSTSSGNFSVNPTTGVVTGITAGTGIVTFTITSTGCLSTAVVTVNPLPTLFNMSANGHYCAGGTGIDVQLSGSQTGFQYDLYDGITYITTLTGTGGILDFGLQPGGSYTVRATDITLPTNCTRTMTGTTVITIDPLPGPILGASGVCAGSTITLSDAGGGTWSSSNILVATIGSLTGVVTGVPLSKGTATITYTLPGTGCITTTVISVRPNYPIYGTFKGCTGDVLTVFDSSDAPAGGTWSATGGWSIVPGIPPTSADINAPTPGTSVITYTGPFGCKATQTVTINPLSAITGPKVVCENSVITLSNPNLGGTWSSHNNAIATVDAFGNVTGVSATIGGGTVQIDYSLSTGCVAGLVITVNPTPTAILGSPKVCLGFVTTLSDALPGGVWSTACSGLMTIGSSSGVVTGIASGTCTISYTMPVTGCMATISFTVNPLPTTIVGTLNLCMGYNGGLSDGMTGGTWTSVTTTVATIDLNLGTLTSVGPGTTIISYTLPTGCYITGLVTVNPTPPPITFVTGTDTLCGGSTITLTDAMVPTGTWSTKSGTISTAIAPPGTILGGGGTGGLDSVIYTSLAGCKIAKYIYVRTLSPIGGPTKMCVGSTFTFTELATGGTWKSSNSGVASVNSSGLVTALTPGVTTIMDTFSTGCYATKTVTVYPMPSPISGPTFTVCAGSTITLSDPSLGGTWTSAPTTVATVNSGTGVVTGVDPLGGTATITYTITVSGCTATAIVTVNPLDTIIGPSSICAGSTATMSDATIGGGTWSTSNTTIAIIGSTSGVISQNVPPLTGVVTVIFTTSLNCTATKTFTVNVVGKITPDNVCVGSTVTLTDAAAPGGGTWSTTSTAIALIGSSGVVTGTTAGTSVVTYTIPGTGCQATILFVTNPLPAAITGNLRVCEGSTTVLSDATPFGTWTSSVTTIGTISSVTGTAGGISGGTTTITYTVSLTGCTAIATLTVDAVAPITGSPGVCIGQTTTLSNAITGGTWSNGCTAFFTVSGGGVVTGVSTGTCTVTYTNPNGCTSTAVITVNALPGTINGPSSVCQGSTITLTDATGGGTWSESATQISIPVPSIGTTVVVTGTGAGTATITYTSGLGCFATKTITVNPVTPIIPASPAVCLGSTITLSDATSPGTWSRGATAIDITSSTGVITTNAVGTSVVTYTITSSGCTTTAIVTVNPLPAVINGPSVVCAGSSIVLTDATAGGVWAFLPPGSVSIAAVTTTATVTGIIGISTISYTLPTGCRATHIVTVNPVPGPITGIKIICAGLGNSTQLTDATAGGTWSSVNTVVGTVGSTSGLVVSQGVVGTTTISYTLNATGCAATTVVTVSPFPNPITGPTEVCVRSTITLSDALTPGVWSSLNSTIATITTPAAVVTGVSAGTATIDYVSPSGCNATYVVTVNPQPLALITPIGSTSLCPGLFVALTANTGTGLSYQWYDATGPVIIAGETNASYIAMPPANTTYEVAVIDSNNCSDTSAGVLVSILTATASITAFPSSGTVCAGTAITLTASGTAPTGYQWELGGVAIPGATNITYSPTVSGSYDAVVSNASGCNARSTPITVTINPKPAGTITAVGPTIFCMGDSVELKGDIGSGLTYQWFNTLGAIPGYTNSSYFFKATGTYHVVVTNSTGCTATSGTVGVTAKPLPTGAVINPAILEFCTGGFVDLTATSDVLPIASFLWYQNGISIGVTGATLKVSTSGRYKALVTDPATGCSVFTPEDTTTLITAPVIVPLSSASFCWGGSAALRANIVAGITPTYQWYVGGVPITGGTNSIYNATAGGSYTVKITSACSITSLAVSVKENPLPNPLLKFDGEHIYTTYSGYVSYQWYKDLVAIPGATHYNVVPSTNGKYKVSVIDTNGCQSMSTEYILTGWTPHFNGVQTPLAQGEIRVFPNPAQDMLHIESADVLKAIITSIDGRVMIQQPNAKDIDIKSLIDGIYTITLYDVNGQMVKADKFVKTTE